MSHSQFSLSADQQNLLDHADRIGREHLYPLAAKMDNEEWWPSDIFTKFGEFGLLGATEAQEYAPFTAAAATSASLR